MSTRTKVLLLPPRALAEAMSMSTDFIYTEIKSENIRAIRIGREIRIAKDEAVRYLEALQAPVPQEWR